MMPPPSSLESDTRTLLDALLEEQRDLSAVERFAHWHENTPSPQAPAHRVLVPLSAPKPGEQYAFEVNLDRCSGCKSCVTACHALNGLDPDESWRSVGLLHGAGRSSFQQTITSACHHCVEPACLHGCPVLAYDKDARTGIVRHLDDQCIGCQYCVLMCPYEVPRYSERLGIVRKCDMCHQRLEHGEAPACAQACPNEAIQITLVEQASLRTAYRAEQPEKGLLPNPFLPDSPAPALTIPATRYTSAKPLPTDSTAGDAHRLKPQPAHLPLVWMLVLTQLGAGAFALLPFTNPASCLVLCAAGLLCTWVGMAISVLHLGRPLRAWRVFLGLRQSWLSREIVMFGCFACLASACSAEILFGRLAGRDSVLLWSTPLFGLAAVFCSAMTYHVTQRDCWRGEFSLGRFFGTTLTLGAAAAWCSATFAGVASAGFALTLVVATLLKLARELAFLQLCPDDAALNEEIPAAFAARSAFLMRFRFGRLLRLRLAGAWAGGVVLPLVSLVPGAPALLVAISGCLLCLLGEWLERLLFFRAAATPRMPGTFGL